MVGRSRRVAVLTASLLLGAAAGPAQPGGIAAARPGLWDVSRSATGAGAIRVCLADPADLVHWENRGASCTRTLLSENANVVVFDYRCTGGGFGRSSLTLLTPRSIRMETQGISDGLPFAGVYHARRAGNCPRPPVR